MKKKKNTRALALKNKKNFALMPSRHECSPCHNCRPFSHTNTRTHARTHTHTHTPVYIKDKKESCDVTTEEAVYVMSSFVPKLNPKPSTLQLYTDKKAGDVTTGAVYRIQLPAAGPRVPGRPPHR